MTSAKKELKHLNIYVNKYYNSQTFKCNHCETEVEVSSEKEREKAERKHSLCLFYKYDSDDN